MVKNEPESDDDVPLGQKRKAPEPDSDDEPLSGKKKPAVKEEKKPVKEEKKSKAVDESDDDVPLSKKKVEDKKPKKEEKKRPNYVDESSDEEPVRKKSKKDKGKKDKKKDKKKDSKKGGKDDPPEKKPKKEVKVEQVYEWWKEEAPLEDGKKWRFLEHNGVIFPPKYEPHGVKLNYEGHGPVDLNPEQEAVATMFAAMSKTDYASKPIFVKNFWTEFKRLLGKGSPITDLKKCDFEPIVEYLEAEKEKKKNLTKEEKLKIKEEREKMEAPYGTVILDSHTEKNGNYRVEPAGLFRGRGEHPKMGQVKGVIAPEDITMNCAVDACPPRCPLPGHAWKSVVHKDDATWLAFYKDTINGEFKYIFLSAGSSLKGQSDREKFEKARELKKHVGGIRKKITQGLKDHDPVVRQQNTALWLIDNLAIRAGNEKDTAEEADTVGCCSMRVEHITIASDEDGPTIFFNFLGKDSIEYKNLLKIRPDDEDRAAAGEADPCISFVRDGEQSNFNQVHKNMGQMCSDKKKKTTDDVFDKIDTSSLNKYLKDLMPGLTAKVFRTYNASYTLDQELHKIGDHPLKKEFLKTETTQLKFYNDANYQVAILCNHSRAVSKSFDAQMEKMDEKKVEIEAEIKSLSKEKKKKEGAAKDAIKKKIATLEARLHNHETQKQIKQKLAGVALSTSKVNYLDPRITVSWCKKWNNFPLSKVFNKSLITKFKWAIDEVDEDWRF